MSIDKEFPNDIEKEKFVLGAMLLKDGEVIPEIAATLSTDDFYRPEHRLIYNAILKIYGEKKPVTILELFTELRGTKDEFGKVLLDKIGMDYVLGITEVAHTTAYALPYAKNIKEYSEQRKIIWQAEKMINDAQEGKKTPLEIIGDTTSAFNTFKGGKDTDFFNVTNYIATEFYKRAENQKQFADRKSGFYNLDKLQSWKTGLYILGATPACGKTTLAWQMLEQFAENGENCLFCSYEMDSQALAAKTIARRLFRYYEKSLPSTKIQLGEISDDFGEMTDSLIRKNLNFTAKQFTDDTDVNKLLAILRPRVKDLERPPIICIDYIQRLIPRDHKAADTRALIDDAIYKLKDFATETNALILGISTFNRTNYNTPPSFENFKESGCIEYTADVVFAMQLNISNNLIGKPEKVIRKAITTAKQLQPREINLRCIKNRFGNDYDVFFQYFSAYDYFNPCTESQFTQSANESEDTNADDVLGAK